MSVVKTHEDLHVWQKSMTLVKDVCRVTEAFPQKERYRLSDQLCRAVISIPSNIAEGSARRSTKEYIRFINIAYGSLMECRTQLSIADRLGYVSQQEWEKISGQCKEIARMLNALYSSLQKKLPSGFFESSAPEYQILNTEHCENANVFS